MKKGIIILLTIIICVIFTGCSNQVEEGTKLMEKGSFKEAAKTFQKAIDDKKDLSEAYLGKGMAYFEMKEYPVAKQSFADAISNGANKTPIIYNMLAICDMEQGNIENAMTSYEEGISVAGDSENYADVVQEMEYNLIVCYERQADWEKAKSKISDYISKYPDDKNAQKESEFLETR